MERSQDIQSVPSFVCNVSKELTNRLSDTVFYLYVLVRPPKISCFT